MGSSVKGATAAPHEGQSDYADRCRPENKCQSDTCDTNARTAPHNHPLSINRDIDRPQLCLATTLRGNRREVAIIEAGPLHLGFSRLDRIDCGAGPGRWNAGRFRHPFAKAASLPSGVIHVWPACDPRPCTDALDGRGHSGRLPGAAGMKRASKPVAWPGRGERNSRRPPVRSAMAATMARPRPLPSRAVPALSNRPVSRAS